MQESEKYIVKEDREMEVTVYVIGERAKRARYSQVYSIENRDNSTYVYVRMSHLPFDL